MTLVEILTLSNERFTGFQTLWSFYITVAVGMLAYVAATFSTSSSALVRFLLIFAFLMFAGANLYALTDETVKEFTFTNHYNTNTIKQSRT